MTHVGPCERSGDFKMFNASVSKNMLSCSAMERKDNMKRAPHQTTKRWVHSLKLPQNTEGKSITVKAQGAQVSGFRFVISGKTKKTFVAELNIDHIPVGLLD